MSVQATVTLDSGGFLPREDTEEPFSAEIGYFESQDQSPEIRVHVDGTEVFSAHLQKLGKNCLIGVNHMDAHGDPRRDGVKSWPSFHDNLLHMKQLYGRHMDTPKDRFDCILRFESGLFCASMVKTRTFREHRKQADGSFAHSKGDGVIVVPSIAHDVTIQFTLEDGEALELARDQKMFWSSKAHDAKQRVDIEIIADKTTVEKFYRHCLKEDLDSYWFPNDPDDPPPTCSKPPCNGGPGGGG